MGTHCRGSTSGLTLEQQRGLMQRAQEEVEAGEPKLAEGDFAAAALPPSVRVMPLGEDRRGALYWSLQCGSTLAGDAHQLLELLSVPWSALKSRHLWKCPALVVRGVRALAVTALARVLCHI